MRMMFERDDMGVLLKKRFTAETTEIAEKE
jgi:hypothetical protein